MRTTIRIDDHLYREVKRRAASSGRTVGEVIEDAVRRSLDAPGSPDRGDLPPLPTVAGSGVLPGIDLADNAGLRDLMEGPGPSDALR